MDHPGRRARDHDRGDDLRHARRVAIVEKADEDGGSFLNSAQRADCFLLSTLDFFATGLAINSAVAMHFSKNLRRPGSVGLITSLSKRQRSR
jgi:hypothetical protein